MTTTMYGVSELKQGEPNVSEKAHSLLVEGVTHGYGNSETVLDDVNLDVRAGEFVTLLGSSGSGKSTLLRIAAGLIAPRRGSVYIDGVDVTAYPVERRDIGLVFQNYSLFPHLDVAENIEFPLKVKKVAAAERRRCVSDVLDLVDLGRLAKRAVGDLSGGQQQRVAIARAVVYRPKILLLDEPLGALDRQLRHSLGANIRRIQQESGITALYVTHDQEEAFLLSDRIAVMRSGSIMQIDTPERLYAEPDSLFVAEFVGETNKIPGTVVSACGADSVIRIGDASVKCSLVGDAGAGDHVTCIIRPERLSVDRPGSAGSGVRLGNAVVTDRTFGGPFTSVRANWGGAALHVRAVSGKSGNAAEAGATVVITADEGAVRAMSN